MKTFNRFWRRSLGALMAGAIIFVSVGLIFWAISVAQTDTAVQSFGHNYYSDTVHDIALLLATYLLGVIVFIGFAYITGYFCRRSVSIGVGFAASLALCLLWYPFIGSSAFLAMNILGGFHAFLAIVLGRESRRKIREWLKAEK